ncbi:acetyl-CoA carboxylase carboxyltransferase subunit alpha/beta [Tessaracoccus sp. SD287]|uniref:carboxyl transferase domain-containing protein n=1 Tax=Tessaracoccus sp. SD287 TaxID=2782008 RepID=UPI001A969C0E|nr:carboxyl transferase domain-containing protein [Tessaracoccus sp. SD287]MBO1030209.1 acetyl-CoA carboxylase carboxyltransferase subunit alpha/beta [Tessaracoccus sp. SD287]
MSATVAAGGAPVKPKRPSARELIAEVFDQGSWSSWDEAPLVVAEAGSAYADDLARAAAKSGEDEAVLTGEGTINGHRVAAVASEFSFLAGSVGQAAAERIVAAFERATRERLPLFAGTASGGTRMQEGTPAFVTMVKITAAVAEYKLANLPYITYLRHPTTGGVFASWGSTGHVTVAEPGATIGFLGARVYEALYGEQFPEGVQTAENLFEHGLVDAVLAPKQLRAVASRLLDIMAPADHQVPSEVPGLDVEPTTDVPAWESVLKSRRPDRPGIRTLLRVGAEPSLPLYGTGAGEHDRSMTLSLARFDGLPCVVLGHDRRQEFSDAPLQPSGLRVARRGIRLAKELNIPLISVIDTNGAALSKEAEEGGMAGEIARCLNDLVTLEVPTICVLLGQGTGGGALALMPADTVICAEHSWLSPLPPEGASAILHRTPDRAPELAAQQGVRSRDLKAAGIVDRIVAELPDAADEPEAFAHRMAAAISNEAAALVAMDQSDRMAARMGRYRRLGL